MRRRDLDGCPIAGALQMIGDKWTMLIIRDLANGPKRTMELQSNLEPISSRTLVGRLRDLVKDSLLERTDYGGNPPHIEYALTERGLLLIPLLDALRKTGESLRCNECEDRKRRRGEYCEVCPNRSERPFTQPSLPARQPRRERDDSIVLL
ncbi:MAG TPA: helix-turn-helix domain-containing protein [Pyrinomonadaceae bacterium]|nr:helix-turn-helix domain-containing protein [Pyrinomonadaceae bacterium]